MITANAEGGGAAVASPESAVVTPPRMSFEELLGQLRCVNELQEQEIARLRAANLMSQLPLCGESDEEIILLERSGAEAGDRPPDSCSSHHDGMLELQCSEQFSNLIPSPVWKSSCDHQEEVSAYLNAGVRGTVVRACYLPTAVQAAAHKQTTVDWAIATADMDASEVEPDGRLKFILHPSGLVRTIWDITCTLLLFYDLVTLPLEAFEPERWILDVVMDVFSQACWSWDMVMSCITAFVEEGVVVYGVGRIIVHYLKTWFFLDVVVNVPDWIALFVEFTAPGGHNVAASGSAMTQSLRVFRVVRTLRILRVAKLVRIFTMIKNRITSESVFVLFRVFKFVALLILLNHVIAALWYLVGRYSSTQDNWPDHYMLSPSEATFGLRYACSLHWSLTQFTPASSGISPRNVYERSFAIVTLTIGLVSSSSLIGSITGSMAQLRSSDVERSNQLWLLRRYLQQHNVGSELSFRINRYAEYITRSRQDMVPQSRIAVLDLLSDDLQEQLSYATHFESLTKHPVCRCCKHLDVKLLHKMTKSTLRVKMLAVGDFVFSLSDVPSHMHYITSGSVLYLPGQIHDDQASASVENEGACTLSADDHLCEVVLWAEWEQHIGQAKACSETHVITVNASEFASLISASHTLAWFGPYARLFVEHVRESCDEKMAEVSTYEKKMLASQMLTHRRSTFALTRSPQ